MIDNRDEANNNRSSIGENNNKQITEVDPLMEDKELKPRKSTIVMQIYSQYKNNHF